MWMMISLVVLLGAGSADAQSRGNVTKFEQSIVSAKISENYVGVLCSASGLNPPYSVYLFDRNGNRLFQKMNLNRWVEMAEQSDKLNYLVVVEQGNEGTSEVRAKPESIISYDINTGSEAWKCESNAGKFVMSPGGEYLATQEIAFDRRSPFEIINLKDGTKRRFGLSIQPPYYADWLDSSRIVIVSYQQHNNPKYGTFHREMAARVGRIDSLQSALLEMKTKGMAKTDSKRRQNRAVNVDEHDSVHSKREKDLIELIKNQQLEYQRWRQVNRVDENVPSAGKLIVYDVIGDKIVVEKLLATSTGTPVILSGAYNGFNVTVTDRFDIYLQNETELLRFDKRISCVWSIKDVPTTLEKIRVDGEMYFRSGETIIDGSTGSIVRPDAIQEKHKRVDLRSGKYGTVNLIDGLFEVDARKGVTVELKNRLIEFQGKEK